MYNFASGPATFPKEVLEEAAKQIIKIDNKELSILEIPHRGSIFKEIIRESEHLVKSLLGLNNDFEVCWMHGGGRTQFGLIPMNFLGKNDLAGFIDTGYWSYSAYLYAGFYGETNVVASSLNDNYSYIPEWETIPEDLAYLYLTSNNTIYGTQYLNFPETKVPIVADMTSDLFTRDLDYKQFDLIFAAAQKNIGPAGVTLVIAKKDFLEKQKNRLPGIFSYKELFEAHSAFNTPPVFAICCSLLYLRWTARIGLKTLSKINEEKAKMLYQAIDSSKIFKGLANPEHRSGMNVCFMAKTPEQEEAFIDFAKRNEIIGIKGHRSIGGLRVALYNAIALEDVAYLVKIIQQFEEVYH